MAKFVEHRRHIVKADQRRLACRRLLEVRHVVDHRQRAQQLRLPHKVAHPRAAVLVVALEVVAIPQRQRLAVRIEHFEHAHIRLIHRNVLPLLERNPVKLVRRVEHAILQHIPDLEVGLHLGFVDVVLRLAHLLGIELPVPRLQLEPALLCINHGLDVLALGHRLRGRRRHQRRP